MKRILSMALSVVFVVLLIVSISACGNNLNFGGKYTEVTDEAGNCSNYGRY